MQSQDEAFIKPQFTVAQKFFFRKLREHGAGMPLQHWPRSTTWRRWMRKPRFVKAITELLASIDSQRQLLMANSALWSANHLLGVLTGGSPADSGQTMYTSDIRQYDKGLNRLLSVLWLERLSRGGKPPALELAERIRELESRLASADQAHRAKPEAPSVVPKLPSPSEPPTVA